jgi:glutamate carboxypeptidase
MTGIPSEASTARVEGDESSAASAGSAESRTLERLRDWVEHESPSGDEARANLLAAKLEAELTAAGAVVESIPAPGWGQHLLARIDGADPELEPVLVLGHLDTVHPVGTLASQPFRIVGGRVEGPGVYDMKAGLAILTEALLLLREAGMPPRRPVLVLITCDEEVGSGTSRELIEETARGAALTLVLEPPLKGGSAKTARKGVATYTLRVKGRAAHAGVEPENGISAIRELAGQIVAIDALADPALGTTINFGLITGGTAGNVVPAEASVEIDLRFFKMEEGARVDAALHELKPILPGAELFVTGGVNRPPLERTEGVVALYRTARALAAEIGLDIGEGATGGGSDGSFTAAIGIPTLDGLGVDGGGAHSSDEHILLADLAPRVTLIRRLLETL